MAELFTIIGEGLALLAHVLAAWGQALIEGFVRSSSVESGLQTNK
jgi:hypothetical protein